MMPDDLIFLKEFFAQVSDQALDPADKRYVPLYDDPGLAGDDPVELLARAIEWTPESVQLFSGYRGTGKSTELKRLKKRLEEQPDSKYLVFLCDVEDFLNLSTPVDVSDFLMAVAGMFGESVRERLGDVHPLHEDYWERLRTFLTKTNVEVTEWSAAGLKAGLKNDPVFKQRLQDQMAGHLGALVADVRHFLEDCVKCLKKHCGDREIVLLLDSVEHIRGTLTNAEAVHSSVENLFAVHSDKLHLPNLHVVYTVPPYLKVRHPNVGALYESGLKTLPACKLRTREGEDIRESFDAMERVVRYRGDWRRLLGEDRPLLDRLIHFSGGHLRDLLRLLREILIRARTLPVPESVASAAINQARTEFLPIPDDDALRLAAIADGHQASLRTLDDLPSLARFFDTHLVLCYRNGEEWYEVHPLVLEHVRTQTAKGQSRLVRE